MKHSRALGLALLLVLVPSIQAQTLNWGSSAGSDFADSNGIALDNTFVFEIGAFTVGFSPAEGNVNDWKGSWNVFDRAVFNPTNGVFASSVAKGLVMTDTGLSNSSFLTGLPARTIPSFEGLLAYLWVRKGDNPEPGSEWFLARADAWVFPNAIPGCCDNGLPIQWSIDDLDNTIPKWGGQGGIGGPGVTSTPGPHDLQTYTFIPEPSSLVLLSLSAGFLLRRRRA